MTAAVIEIVGVTLTEREEPYRQTERVGGDLRVGRLMALAVGMRADADIDPAVLIDPQFRDLIGLAARGFDEAGIAEAAQLAPPARVPLPRLEAFGGLNREIDRVAKAALLD